MVTSLKPDGSRSLAVVGDVHHGSIVPRRPLKLRDAWNHISPGMPDVAVLAFVGDLCEGQKSMIDRGGAGSPLATMAQQMAVAKPWVESFDRADVVKISFGNHDDDRHDDGSGTVEEFEADWGIASPAYYITDTPHFRLVVCRESNLSNPLVTVDQQTPVENAIAAVPDKPCILMHHYAARDSHDPLNKYGLHASSNTLSPVYSGALSAGSDGFIKAMALRRPNLVATIHGHTHANIDVLNLHREWTLSNGRKLRSINCSALTYIGGANAPAGYHALLVPVITFYDDRMEVRWRDVGAGSWVARNGLQRVEEFLY